MLPALILPISKLPPVMLPVTDSSPVVVTLPPVIFPDAETILLKTVLLPGVP